MNCQQKYFPNIALLLGIILVCPSSGAVVERGFSVRNLAMNKLQSSMKVTTLDAIMRIHYEKDLEASDILEVWKKEVIGGLNCPKFSMHLWMISFLKYHFVFCEIRVKDVVHVIRQFKFR